MFNVTDVDDEHPAANLPTEYQLNEVTVSANPGKTHEINARTKSEVQWIRVYDMLGQVVKNVDVANYDKMLGITNGYWDGTNDVGMPVVNATYIVSIGTTNGKVHTAKIMQHKAGIEAKINGISNNVTTYFQKKMNKQARLATQQEETNAAQETTTQQLSKTQEGGTKYHVKIRPLEGGTEFTAVEFDREIFEGINTFIDTVNQWKNEVDYSGVFEDMYTGEVQPNVIMRWVDTQTGIEYADTTDEQGEYNVEDLSTPTNYTVEIEVGNEYYKVRGYKPHIAAPTGYDDTSRVWNQFLPKKAMRIPNSEETILSSKDFLKEMFYLSEMNPEEDLGRGVHLWAETLSSQSRDSLQARIAQGVEEYYEGEYPFI